MIIVVKKSNVILIGLIFMLLAAIYSLNIGAEEGAVTAAGTEVQRTVVLDAGHGGEDPGKVSGYSDLKEKDINLKIAFKVKELLEKENYKVIMTREEDKLVYTEGTTNIYDKRKQDLTQRKKIMDESGADIVVSIHLNGFPEAKYYGAQTFYPPNSEKSLKLANSLQNSLRELVDPGNKRQPQEKKDPIVILKDLVTPTAIVECGFLSNAEEEKKLGTEEYQAKLAGAIVDGIKNYFK
jgi:N-acetylmuramoyl-L-alanine amidase